MINNNHYDYFRGKYQNQVLLFNDVNYYLIVKEDVEKCANVQLTVSEIGKEKVIRIPKENLVSVIKQFLALKIAFATISARLSNGEIASILSSEREG